MESPARHAFMYHSWNFFISHGPSSSFHNGRNGLPCSYFSGTSGVGKKSIWEVLNALPVSFDEVPFAWDSWADDAFGFDEDRSHVFIGSGRSVFLNWVIILGTLRWCSGDGCAGGGDAGGGEVPEAEMPEAKVPEAEMPEAKVPEAERLGSGAEVPEAERLALRRRCLRQRCWALRQPWRWRLRLLTPEDDIPSGPQNEVANSLLENLDTLRCADVKLVLHEIRLHRVHLYLGVTGRNILMVKHTAWNGLASGSLDSEVSLADRNMKNARGSICDFIHRIFLAIGMRGPDAAPKAWAAGWLLYHHTLRRLFLLLLIPHLLELELNVFLYLFDEPMAPLDKSTTVNNPQIIQGPITRARARQLNHQVNSFLAVPVVLDGLLLNSCDVLLLRNMGEAPQVHHELPWTKSLEDQVYSETKSSPSRTPNSARSPRTARQ